MEIYQEIPKSDYQSGDSTLCWQANPQLLQRLLIFFDAKDLQNKIKNLRILVTAYVVGLYPNIPHKIGLKSLEEALDRRREKK